MIARFVSTTNPKLRVLIDKECDLRIDLKAYFSFDPEGAGFYFRQGKAITSSIKKVEYEKVDECCTLITINTKNSIYEFLACK